MNSFRIAFAFLIALPLAFAALLFALPTPAPAREAGVTAIVGVRVFDGENLLSEPQTVLIENGLIRALGADVAVPDGAAVVDGAGKTLLPGLIDAHTHVYGEVLSDAARFGVTTELDLFSPPSGLAAFHAARGSLAPSTRADVFSAGMLATAPGGHGTEYGVPVETLTTPQEAQDWVDARIAEGSDYIKIVYEAPGVAYTHFPSIDRATLAALVEAAHARGKLAVVHALGAASARDAVEAGADGLAHVFLDPIDDALRDAIAQRGVFVISTLAAQQGFAAGPEAGEALLGGTARARLSGAQRAALAVPQTAFFPPSVLANGAANVRALSAAGVAILAGTDAPNPATAHGASLHAELALLVRAGLTPTEALRAATSVPAARFDLAGRGRIRAGDRADLVLVDGDPTADIAATQAIVAVWKNGAPVALSAAAVVDGEPLAPGMASDFNDGALTSAWGVDWIATTDTIMGGSSQAQLSLTEAGALRAVGEVHGGTMAPWAGAALSFTPDWSGSRDLSAIRTLSFRVRGAPGRYRVMAFATGMNRAPPEQSFEAASDWRRVSIALSGFAGFDAGHARAFAWVAGPAPGAFQFEIDDVQFE